MLSVLFKHRLRVIDEESGRPCRPAEALRALNTSLRRDITAPGLFITAAYCLLDTGSRELVVSSAGHPPLLWLRANGEARNIGATGPALGLYADAVFTEHRCRLGQGDQMLLYTDGLLDPEREHPSGTERIAGALRSLEGDQAPLRKLFGELARGASWEDRDDATIVLLEARPGESSFDEPARDESPARSPRLTARAHLRGVRRSDADCGARTRHVVARRDLLRGGGSGNRREALPDPGSLGMRVSRQHFPRHSLSGRERGRGGVGAAPHSGCAAFGAQMARGAEHALRARPGERGRGGVAPQDAAAHRGEERQHARASPACCAPTSCSPA